MKKFLTIIPLQTTKPMQYEAVDNPVLQMDEAVQFPILTAISGYAQPGEEIRVIAVLTDNGKCRENLEKFSQAVEELCAGKGVSCSAGVEAVFIPEDDSVSTHVETFQKLIEYVEDDDDLYACMTFGTKPTSNVLLLAVQYAYRVKRNASIACILYGQVVRPDSDDKTTWFGKVYDMTTLVQLDEMVHLLAAANDPDPARTIRRFLSL